MLIFTLSPAKTLDFGPNIAEGQSKPRLLAQSRALVEVLKDYDALALAKLMDLSENLAKLNAERYQQFGQAGGKAALWAFRGDVYKGLDADSLSSVARQRAEGSLRILSGLYGLLRPSDAIEPHRLEMGTSLNTPQGKNLYEFWGSRITDLLRADAQEAEAIINLASEEYSKAVQWDKLGKPVYQIRFMEKGGKQGYRVVAIHAKKARGLMARYILEQNCQSPQDLKQFNLEGYYYQSDYSEGQTWAFVRD